MTSDLRIQGEVVVNSEQAESAFNRVGDKAQQMATEVATSAGKAGQSVDKIGDGAGASAEKFTRAESRISASIKRATNELELLGKTASQRLEFNIADKGLDPKKFEPARVMKLPPWRLISCASPPCSSLPPFVRKRSGASSRR